MYNALDILNKVLIEDESDDDRLDFLRSKEVDLSVREYLKNKLQGLYIEILTDYRGSLFDLMDEEKLEGWCWQTTESAIVFLDDDDYIERGYIKLREFSSYYHSWICFKFNDTEYVFDPCLNILCQKSDYMEVLKPHVKGIISAKAEKEALINKILNPKEECNIEEYQDAYKRIEDEVRVDYLDEVNDPFYRNGSGYIGEIDNGTIKKLTVHYYENMPY